MVPWLLFYLSQRWTCKIHQVRGKVCLPPHANNLHLISKPFPWEISDMLHAEARQSEFQEQEAGRTDSGF